MNTVNEINFIYANLHKIITIKEHVRWHITFSAALACILSFILLIHLNCEQ